MKLKDLKYKMMSYDSGVTDGMEKYLHSMCINKKRPLGKFNPWAWWVEITRGCNIKCGHCPTVLFPEGYREYMPRDVWVSMLKVINEITPYSRLELCNAGEPTLHPDLLEYLHIARKICPNLQILTYTNGTMLTNGKLTYKQLFDAGLNMVFVDMYAPFEKHKQIAEQSGYYWFFQDDKPKDAPNIFQYQNNPNAHYIMLANPPSKWSKRKLGRGYLQTFFNDLDFEQAAKFGIKPVTQAPNRRCDLPYKFVNVNWDGTFIFCCFDYMRHTVNEFGNIKEGVDGFMKFWLGKYMQHTRQKVNAKDRNSHEYCCKCRFTAIRCDIPCWKNEGIIDKYWDGVKWNDK